MPVQRWTRRERRLLGGLQEVPLGHLGAPGLSDDPLHLTMKFRGTRTPQDLGKVSPRAAGRSTAAKTDSIR